MGLKRLTDRIYYLEHEPETDRPMLAYIRGDKWPLACGTGGRMRHIDSGALSGKKIQKGL